ncbi:MAG: hypothetical protein Kow0069_13640 [Promethearchaeota archaeon]
MTFQIPEGTPAEYLRGVDLPIWMAAITLHYVFAFVFASRSRKADLASQKWLYRAFAAFMATYGVTRVLFAVAVYDPDNYDAWVNLGYVFGIAAFVPIIVVVERFLIPQTKFAFSALGVVLSVVSVLGLAASLEREFILQVTQVAAPVLFGVVFLLYVVLVKQSTGIIRKKSARTLVGMLFLGLGIVLDGEAVLTLGVVPLWIAPVVYLLGVVLIGVYQSASTD